MSKDTRTVLDAVCSKIPPDAKMVVCWIGASGQLHAAHANMSQGDVARAAEALHASTLTMPGGILVPA